MRKLVSLILSLMSIIYNSNAQDYKDNILITIDDREITAGEFERVYNKNNNETISEKQSVEEYLELFINYKLKVVEAEKLGMDTASQFLSEFNAYRKQLAQPYLTSKELTDKYAKEAYERMAEEVDASHIMVRLQPDASPEDTLYAYNKLMEIRDRINKGEDFGLVARATSDDPSAKNNAGHLGWFSAFRMVYPFETAAYNTQPGEISDPVRSNYGYHIIKVNGRRKARGSRQVAHVFKRSPQSMTDEEATEANEKIFMVYDSLKLGVPFAELALRFSDDQASAQKGGILPWFSSGQLIPVFDSVAFLLENIGDFSEPLKSDYGWHIIKLMDKKDIGTFEEEKAEILSNIKKGDRGKSKDEAFIRQLKDEYGYKFFDTNYSKMLSALDSTVFSAEWTAEKASPYFDLPLFTIGEKEVKIEEFAEYFETKQIKRNPVDLRMLLKSGFEAFEFEEIIAFEESNLESKYPEFRHIVQEYHDGILLFELTDKKVWSKAVEDTVGLEKYFNDHKDNYMWGKRAKTLSIVLEDSTLSINDIKKRALKLIKQNKFDPGLFKAEFCNIDTSAACMDINVNKYEKGDNDKVDEMKWKPGSAMTYSQERYETLLIIKEILDPSVKKLDETRGLVIADYQKFLEDKWIAELRENHDIKVNTVLLSKIQD